MYCFYILKSWKVFKKFLCKQTYIQIFIITFYIHIQKNIVLTFKKLISFSTLNNFF